MAHEGSRDMHRRDLAEQQSLPESSPARDASLGFCFFINLDEGFLS